MTSCSSSRRAPRRRHCSSFQPLASLIQTGKAVSNAQIATVGAPTWSRCFDQEMVIVPAQKASPNQWKTWWWVCIGGQVVFFLLVFAMKGRWSPAAARRDMEERERLVAEELARIQSAPVPQAAVH